MRAFTILLLAGVVALTGCISEPLGRGLLARPGASHAGRADGHGRTRARDRHRRHPVSIGAPSPAAPSASSAAVNRPRQGLQRRRVVGAVLNGVAGGAIEGHYAQEGYEITVKLDGGRTIAVAQEAGEEFKVGESACASSPATASRACRISARHRAPSSREPQNLLATHHRVGIMTRSGRSNRIFRTAGNSPGWRRGDWQRRHRPTGNAPRAADGGRAARRFFPALTRRYHQRVHDPQRELVAFALRQRNHLHRAVDTSQALDVGIETVKEDAVEHVAGDLREQRILFAVLAHQ